MRFNYDMTGVQEQGEFVLIPIGEYDFEIDEVTEKETQNGDPMFGIKLDIITGDYRGLSVYDNIVFPKIGSPAEKIKGRSMHFLHCINEPYEGKFAVNTDNWTGKQVRASVKHEMYEGKTYAKINNYILSEAQTDVPF